VSRDLRLRLADIAEACRRIESYTTGMDLRSFRADPKTVDAVVRNLEVIGEAVKNLPDDFRARQPEIEWRRIAGLRDLLIHAYHGIDDEIVWNVVATKVPGLRRLVEHIILTDDPTL
jgi:uncharacterized protein with HEPN domain